MHSAIPCMLRYCPVTDSVSANVGMENLCNDHSDKPCCLALDAATEPAHPLVLPAPTFPAVQDCAEAVAAREAVRAAAACGAAAGAASGEGDVPAAPALPAEVAAA